MYMCTKLSEENEQSSVWVFSKTVLSHAMDKEAKIPTEQKFIAHRKRPQKVKEADHPKQESYEQDSRVNICQIMTELVKYLRRQLLLSRWEMTLI